MCSIPEDCQVVCEAETVASDSGTTYTWPETLGGRAATFICPLNTKFSVNRRCSLQGEWQTFDREGCGVVNELLNRLNSTFNNVSKCYLPCTLKNNACYKKIII